MTQDAVDDLCELLDLEAIEVNIFRGISPKEDRQRVFGGQVAGQALVAAGRTVERGSVHSLHAYFLRPGDPTVPILYEVDRIRDGRSFTTRRVIAIQHGRAIFNLSASFHVDEPGFEHPVPMPDVPEPGSRHVVPPAVPGRRLAALRPGEPGGGRRPGPGPGADLPTGRHARHLGRAGRPRPGGRVTRPRPVAVAVALVALVAVSCGGGG